MISSKPVKAIDALNAYKAKYPHSFPKTKILVSGFDVECIRFGKIVHIQTVRRLPKIHADGRVTIRAFNDEYEIKAEELTLDSTGQSWISYSLA